MFNYRDNIEKSSFYMKKLKEENDRVNEQKDLLISENEELRNKVAIY